MLFTNNNCYLIITGKWNCAETTYREYKRNNFIGHFENKLIKEIRRKYPDKDFVFTEMGYSEYNKGMGIEIKENCMDYH